MTGTSRKSASILVGASLLITGMAWMSTPGMNAASPLSPAYAASSGFEAGGTVAAGLGIVEPASGIINLSAPMLGVIASITKAEGDRVQQGEVIAELINDDLKAQVAQAESTVSLEEARLALIENGPRPEEIAKAQARLREEATNLKLFETKLARHQALVSEGAVARETLNETQRALAASRERMAAATQELDILRQGSRKEEIESARASYKLALAKLAEARATLNKSYVRSPIDGVVLRRFMEPGEAMTAQTAAVIVQIADTSRLIVRTQIDENDIGDLKIGQKAKISAPSLRGKTLFGTVSRISPRLGAKTVTAETPEEKLDTRVLEVIVALDPDVSVPINLRVDVVIDLDSAVAPAPVQHGALNGSLRLAISNESCSAGKCPPADRFGNPTTGSIAP